MASGPARRRTARAARRRPPPAAIGDAGSRRWCWLRADRLIVGLLAGKGGGGDVAQPEEVVRIQREAQPVHFTVSVSGDLLIHSPLWERALALGGGSHYDFAPVLAELKPYVADADAGICHVETPMTPAPPTSYPIFNTPPALAQGIKATGWDACDTASNHSLDQGQTGHRRDRRGPRPAAGSRTRAPSRRRRPSSKPS